MALRCIPPDHYAGSFFPGFGWVRTLSLKRGRKGWEDGVYFPARPWKNGRQAGAVGRQVASPSSVTIHHHHHHENFSFSERYQMERHKPWRRRAASK